MVKQIFAKRLFTGSETLRDQLVICEEGRIREVRGSHGSEANERVDNLSAGFFDTHINGGERFYLTKDPTAETLNDIDASCETLGTAYTLPTVITSPPENIFHAIEVMKDYRSQHPGTGVLGMHLEGPFLSPAKRGAHLLKYIQRPTDEIIREIINRGGGTIKLMTIAPEQFSEKQLAMLLESGITVSAGHSNASYVQANAAFARGIGLVTHLYNAMSAFTHREPGLVGASLNNGDVYAPIILDGHHCDFGAAAIAYKMKRGKLFLISDALFVGGKVKAFQWGEFDATLQHGRYVNSEGNLAGANISLADAMVNAVNRLGIPLQEAVEMCTVRPARAVGVESQTGSVAKGFPAVFTAFSDSLAAFRVIRG